MKKNFVIAIVGPTASGKTGLAIELAKRINGEIVSADSMQIYKEMNIATAKPSEDEMKMVKHHLIGIVEPTENFSVAQFKSYVEAAIEDIISRGKTPIVVGGTGFYIDTLVNNTEFFNYEKSNIRKELEERAEKDGIESLFNELKTVDKKTGERLHINDTKRIIRALEVYYSTGKTISEQTELSHSCESPYEFSIIGLTAENRQYLYDRINLRVDMMVQEGLIEEAKEFFSNSYSNTAKQAIGYKELKPYLDGSVKLDEAIEKLKMETRRYAKRQLTWFRRNEKIHWLFIDKLNSKELLEETIKLTGVNIGGE